MDWLKLFVFFIGILIPLSILIAIQCSTYSVYLGETETLNNTELDNVISNHTTQCPHIIEAYDCCGYTTLYCERYPFLHIYSVSGAFKDYLRINFG
jgi:hypothetical protein